MILRSDKPLTPEDEAKIKAKMEELRKLPPANPLVPGFELETPEGKKITLQDLHGKIVLLDYWATWCAPCVEGLPELDAVFQKYRGNPNVVILAVNPLVGDTDEKAKSFSIGKHLSVPVVFDKHFGGAAKTPKGGVPKTVFSLPVLLLLDRDGKQQWFSTGGEVGDTTHVFQRELIAKIDGQLNH
jgi:thiol-disulfide isomerase/thioredoxin